MKPTQSNRFGLPIPAAGLGTIVIVLFSAIGANAQTNTKTGKNAGSSFTTGTNNTANGFYSLHRDTTGSGNTAFGSRTLSKNVSGNHNTAVGNKALTLCLGNANTALGASVLGKNTTGINNIGAGAFSLSTNSTGSNNTALGRETLKINTLGSSNTAVGLAALSKNVIGNLNTAIGDGALFKSTGNQNIALGEDAGFNLTSGNNNIYIGNQGGSTESGKIRIGKNGTHKDTYISGIIHGNGSGLKNLSMPASALTGQISNAQLKNFSVGSAKLGPNLILAGTTKGTFQGNVTGNADTATLAGNVSGIVAIANGGTGSATQNFVDLSTNQTIAGVKQFTNALGFNSQWVMLNRSDNYFEIYESGVASRFVIQDGTGNVGIGETVSPAYKLDVLHDGTSGIRSKSSAGASVIDIDASDGNAALRLAKAGVNQWSIGNRAIGSNFEIAQFTFGSNTKSHFVIENSSGNIGIGQTDPDYKLDILHGGFSGIRCKSEFAYSVVDIDAKSGDAALRFASDGVSKWNIRNQPAANNLQFLDQVLGVERMQIQNGTGRVGIGRSPTANRLEVEGTASKTTATAWLANSDRRIKQDIKTIDHALEKIEKVRLVDFRYTEDYRKQHPSIEDKRYMNVIAQEFAKVFPDHVASSGEKLPDGSEVLQVDTYPLTIYSAAAIQELSKKLDAKDSEIERLKKENLAMKKQLDTQTVANKDIEARLSRLEQSATPATVPVKADNRW